MRPAEAAAPARPDNIRVTRRGWRCRVGPKPLGDLGRDAGFEAVAGQLEGGNSRSAPEVVEDRAAVGVPGPAALNCSATYTHSVSPSAVGVGQLAERPGDELAGALLVLGGERDELDVGEPGDAQVGPAGHQPLGRDRIEMAAPEAGRGLGLRGRRRARPGPGGGIGPQDGHEIAHIELHHVAPWYDLGPATRS